MFYNYSCFFELVEKRKLCLIIYLDMYTVLYYIENNQHILLVIFIYIIYYYIILYTIFIKQLLINLLKYILYLILKPAIKSNE